MTTPLILNLILEQYKEELKLKKYWDKIEPYPYGDLIINIITIIVVSPA